MNDHNAGSVEFPRSAYLENTLRRARAAAEQRSHRYVTLEHLLFALMDDPDAVRLIQALGAGLASIKAAASDTVNNKLSSLAVPGERSPSFSYKFDGLFQAVSDDAIRLGRREIDGGLALIAIVKDRESMAAAILTANGFHPQGALHYMGAPQAPPAPGSPAQRPSSVPAGPAPQPRAPEPQLQPAPALAPVFQPTPAASSSELNMEEMLTSVRNILDAEERKERGGRPPAPPPLPPALPVPPAQPRFEPQLRLDPGHAPQGSRNPAPRELPSLTIPEVPAAPRPVLPVPSQAAPDRRPRPAQVFSEPPPPAFDHGHAVLSAPVPETRKPRTRERRRNAGQGEAPPAVIKMLEGIPRRVRFGTPVTAGLHLSKEEAAALIARMGRRGQPRLGAEAHAASRAVTIRLSAPEGGLYAEPLTPETQWIFARPPSPGEEPFGTWAWALIPHEKGTASLSLAVSVRDIDGGGLAVELKIPGQEIRVKVHGSFWRALAAILNAALLVLAGGGLTVGAWYALKFLGKLPH